MTGKSQGMPKCGKLVALIRGRASNMQMWENPSAPGPKGAPVRASGGPRSSSSTNSPAGQTQHSPLCSLAQAPGRPGTLRQLFQKTRVLAEEGQSAPWLMEGWLSGQSYPAGSPLLHGTGGGRAICIPDKPVSAQVRHRIKLKKVCEKVKMVHTQIVTLYKNTLHRF